MASLFAGAGGLDRGFESAGFETVWANEFDKDVWETFKCNFENTHLDKRSILDICLKDIPNVDGLIGGPPCQSWSEAGALRGIDDVRGKLFFEFIKILRAKKPKFFLIENVSGMLMAKHATALNHIKTMLVESGYKLSFRLLNASDYGVPQDRKRVFFVGIREDLGFTFVFPDPLETKFVLRDFIFDIRDCAVEAKKNESSLDVVLPNHEYMAGSFSSMYMSRNRVRDWNEPSFTIQAGGRHAPLHPQAPKMELVEKDKRKFVEGKEDLYRRLSVRECARIQTFPDNHIFHYKNISAGYKMVGNAVPCKLAFYLAQAVRSQLKYPPRMPRNLFTESL